MKNPDLKKNAAFLEKITKKNRYNGFVTYNEKKKKTASKAKL